MKAETAKLHAETKKTIEELTDEQVYELLKLKWITPLINSLNNLLGSVLQQLSDKVQALAEKYATTFADIMNEINETKSSLALQINELTGNEFDMKGLSEFKVLLNAE